MALLKGKIALVTGSTSGIGLGIAHALAAQGADVVLNGFAEPALVKDLVHDFSRAHGVKAFHSTADMSQPAQIEAMFGQIQTQWGSVDILVNNAGIQHVAPIEEFPPDQWNAIIAVNLNAAFHTMRLAVPAMKARGWGRIVNIASAHALVASSFKSAYVAAKHGVAGLTKTVALEVATHGITVNAVCPGYVWTPLVQQQIPATARARGLTEEQVINDVLLHAQPTKQFVTVEQLGAFSAFLCSDSAASITGAILPVEGGWTAQ